MSLTFYGLYPFQPKRQNPLCIARCDQQMDVPAANTAVDVALETKVMAIDRGKMMFWWEKPKGIIPEMRNPYFFRGRKLDEVR